MKAKIKVTLLALMGLTMLSACIKDDSKIFDSFFGEVTTKLVSGLQITSDNSKYYSLQTDLPIPDEIKGERVLVSYWQDDTDRAKSTEKNIIGKLAGISVISQKKLTPSNFFSDEKAMLDSVGIHKIMLEEAFFSAGKYLNISYRAGYNDASKLRFVNLLVDSEKSTEDEIYAKLCYKAEDIDNNYPIYDKVGQSAISFIMSEYMNKPFKIHIKFDTDNSITQVKTFEFDPSSTKSAGKIKLSSDDVMPW